MRRLVGAVATGTATAAPSEIPEETAGPFPGDGSNGPNVLTESGVVRQDITKSFGDASGVAEGIPTTVTMTLLDIAGGGAPLAGAAVYLWHCDIAGRYSLYDQEVANENYLRGVQESDAERQGHVQDDLPGGVLRALAAHPLRGLREPRRRDGGADEAAHVAARDPAGGVRRRVRDRGLRAERPEPGQTSLDSDMVFSDGYASQLATATGSVDDGYTLTLNVGRLGGDG